MTTLNRRTPGQRVSTDSSRTGGQEVPRELRRATESRAATVDVLGRNNPLQAAIASALQVKCGPDTAQQLVNNTGVQWLIEQAAVAKYLPQAQKLVKEELAFQYNAFCKDAAYVLAWLAAWDLIAIATDERPGSAADLRKRVSAISGTVGAYHPTLNSALSGAVDIIEQIKSLEKDLGRAQAACPMYAAKLKILLGKDLIYYWGSPIPVRPRMADSKGVFPISAVVFAQPLAKAMCHLGESSVKLLWPPAEGPFTCWWDTYGTGRSVPGALAHITTRHRRITEPDSVGRYTIGNYGQLRAPKEDTSGWYTGHLLADYLAPDWFTTAYGRSVARLTADKATSAAPALRAWAAAQGVEAPVVRVFDVASWLDNRDVVAGGGTDRAMWLGYIQAAQNAYRATVLQPILQQINQLLQKLYAQLAMLAPKASTEWHAIGGFWVPVRQDGALASEVGAIAERIERHLGAQKMPVGKAAEEVLAFLAPAKSATPWPATGRAPFGVSSENLLAKLWSYGLPQESDWLRAYIAQGSTTPLAVALANNTKVRGTAVSPDLSGLPSWLAQYIDLKAEFACYSKTALLAGALGKEKSGRLGAMWEDLSVLTVSLYGFPLPPPPASGKDLVKFYTDEMAKMQQAPAPGSLSYNAKKATAALTEARQEYDKLRTPESYQRLAQLEAEAGAATQQVVNRIGKRRDGWGISTDRAQRGKNQGTAALENAKLFAALEGRAVDCGGTTVAVLPSEADQANIAAAKKDGQGIINDANTTGAGSVGSSVANTELLGELGITEGPLVDLGKENKDKGTDLVDTVDGGSGLGWILALFLAGAVAKGRA
jgi:hypothetical protein